MSELTPQPGDKVRVTTVREGVVKETGDLYFTMDMGEHLSHTYDRRDSRSTVEILERADDPSRDPIGTIRGDRFIKLTEWGRGYAVVVWNQASHCPDLLDGSFSDTFDEALEIAEAERAETKAVGRGETYTVVELVEAEDGQQ